MSRFMFADEQVEFLKEAITEVERKSPEGHFALYLLKCMLGLNPGEITPDIRAWADKAIFTHEHSIRAPGGFVDTKPSENVFREIGLPNPDEHLKKAEIVMEIHRKLSDGNVDISLVSEQSGLPVQEILKGHFSDIEESELVRLNESL